MISGCKVSMYSIGFAERLPFPRCDDSNTVFPCVPIEYTQSYIFCIVTKEFYSYCKSVHFDCMILLGPRQIQSFLWFHSNLDFEFYDVIPFRDLFLPAQGNADRSSFLSSIPSNVRNFVSDSCEQPRVEIMYRVVSLNICKFNLKRSVIWNYVL